MVVKDRITMAFPLIRVEALKLKGQLPPGLSLDDLESRGNEALVEASANFDPTTGSKWMGFARLWIRNKLKDFLRSERLKANRHRPLDIPSADGETSMPRADRRAANPSDRASAREELDRHNAGLEQAAFYGLPRPDQVAEKVAALRAAMFGGVETGDATEVMRLIVSMAKSGDLRAAKLFLDYIQPRAGNVQQQAIVINPKDL